MEKCFARATSPSAYDELKLKCVLANSYSLKKSPIFDREKSLNYLNNALAAIKKLRAKGPLNHHLLNIEKEFKKLKKEL